MFDREARAHYVSFFHNESQDAEAEAALGWVIEMWGYAVAAAAIGLKHQEYRDFQARVCCASRAETILCLRHAQNVC